MLHVTLKVLLDKAGDVETLGYTWRLIPLWYAQSEDGVGICPKNTWLLEVRHCNNMEKRQWLVFGELLQSYLLSLIGELVFLQILDPVKLANWSVTHVDWSEGKWHPKSYEKRDVTKDTFARIQASEHFQTRACQPIYFINGLFVVLISDIHFQGKLSVRACMGASRRRVKFSSKRLWPRWNDDNILLILTAYIFGMIYCRQLTSMCMLAVMDG